MFSKISPNLGPIESETYPLGENPEQWTNGPALALVALSHSTLEHRLYSAMLPAVSKKESQSFTARGLMTLTGIRSVSTVRRGLGGLLAKFSIQRNRVINGNGRREPRATYLAFPPEEILVRRTQNGINLSTNVWNEANHSFDRAIARVAENEQLSRREAQVALCCVEGLTNAQIGRRLEVTEQTVKFHLRNIFVKFGVRRRAELISRLLM
jgi:DNA-binding CsgD family transcriptional regulator